MGDRANDRQVGGTHYKDRTIEPWDYITANNLGFLEGNIIKYVTRHPDKNGLADLEKARHYLDKLIETLTPEPDPELPLSTYKRYGQTVFMCCDHDASVKHPSFCDGVVRANVNKP